MAATNQVGPNTQPNLVIASGTKAKDTIDKLATILNHDADTKNDLSQNDVNFIEQQVRGNADSIFSKGGTGNQKLIANLNDPTKSTAFAQEAKFGIDKIQGSNGFDAKTGATKEGSDARTAATQLTTALKDTIAPTTTGGSTAGATNIQPQNGAALATALGAGLSDAAKSLLEKPSSDAQKTLVKNAITAYNNDPSKKADISKSLNDVAGSTSTAQQASTALQAIKKPEEVKQATDKKNAELSKDPLVAGVLARSGLGKVDEKTGAFTPPDEKKQPEARKEYDQVMAELSKPNSTVLKGIKAGEIESLSYSDKTLHTSKSSEANQKTYLNQAANAQKKTDDAYLKEPAQKSLAKLLDADKDTDGKSNDPKLRTGEQAARHAAIEQYKSLAGSKKPEDVKLLKDIQDGKADVDATGKITGGKNDAEVRAANLLKNDKPLAEAIDKLIPATVKGDARTKQKSAIVAQVQADIELPTGKTQNLADALKLGLVTSKTTGTGAAAKTTIELDPVKAQARYGLAKAPGAKDISALISKEKMMNKAAEKLNISYVPNKDDYVANNTLIQGPELRKALATATTEAAVTTLLKEKFGIK